jgi:SAM-dependent methyltransferase
MKNIGSTLRTSMDVDLEPSAAFEVFVRELADSLFLLELRFEAGPDGRIFQNGFEVGRVIAWEPGKHVVFRWRQASWEPEEVTEVELRLDPVGSGTNIVLEHRNWGKLVGDSSEIAGWFASEVAAPLLRSTAPAALGDWITDRRARRPSGAQARSFYRDPLYHYPGFRVILSELALKPDDYLLEVGCGGGAFLKEALKIGCRVAAVDHSPVMVELARDVNREAVNAGRVMISEASADRLPFPDGMFTCAVMTGVVGFLTDPVGALAEIRRTLCTGGRLVVQGTDPEMRGTPAAPEPMASRLHFYDDEELGNLGRDAGFPHVRVVRRNLEQYAREAGVPEEAMPLFAGPGSRFLLARKE